MLPFDVQTTEVFTQLNRLCKDILPFINFVTSWQDSLFSKKNFIEDDFLNGFCYARKIQLTISGVNKRCLHRQITYVDVSQLLFFPTYRTIFLEFPYNVFPNQGVFF